MKRILIKFFCVTALKPYFGRGFNVVIYPLVPTADYKHGVEPPDNQTQLARQIPVYEIEDGEIDNGRLIKLILILSAILLTGILGYNLIKVKN